MRKTRLWCACTMDDGVIATGTTYKEVLKKLGRRSARYISRARYELYEGNETKRWSVLIYGNEKLMRENGFDIADNRNTFHLDKLYESQDSPKES